MSNIKMIPECNLFVIELSVGKSGYNWESSIRFLLVHALRITMAFFVLSLFGGYSGSRFTT